jgi:hypothetical protein
MRKSFKAKAKKKRAGIPPRRSYGLVARQNAPIGYDADCGRVRAGRGHRRASVAGLEALKKFFGAMPPRTGLTFVVVVHLDSTASC